MNRLIESIDSFVSGPYFLMPILVGAGIYMTFRLGWVQLRGFRHGLALITGRYDNPQDAGEITHFQALSAALSATIGIGNIAGVATAIHLGGPGAVAVVGAVRSARLADATAGVGSTCAGARHRVRTQSTARRTSRP